jgi:hypothetical protein
MTPKGSTGMSPYTLVYGKEEKVPISLELNALTFVVYTKDAEGNSLIQRRIKRLLKLEEELSRALNRTNQRHQSIKIYFDQNATVNNFQKENWCYSRTKPRRNHQCTPNLNHFGLDHTLSKRSWVLIPIFSKT